MKKFVGEKLSENIDSIAKYDFDNEKVFGSAYLVCKGGKELVKCYGTTSLNSNQPITENTLFRLASMTKPITAVATLILVDRGLISLDDSVDKYLPEFKNIKLDDGKDNTFAPKKLPTIRNMLSHTSGIGSNPEKNEKMTLKDKQTIDSSIAYHINAGLFFEPNTAQRYSSTGAFDGLAKIIELVTKTDYLTFLKKEIFEPCGMVDTTFTPNADQQKRLIAMHVKVDGKKAVYEMPKGCIFEDFPCEHYLGGAGLVSTLRDYANFTKMLLNKGQTDKGRIISEKVFNELCTAQVSPEIMPGDTQWGCGVRVITDDSHPLLPKGAYGWSGAYGSHFWIDNENDLYAVFMKNCKFDGGAYNESSRLFEKAVYVCE